jgi:hypothetical protein
MSDDPKDLWIEQAASAFRERDSWGRILVSPAWLDLAPEDRSAAFKRQLESRILERSLHGITSTAQAVLARIKK